MILRRLLTLATAALVPVAVASGTAAAQSQLGDVYSRLAAEFGRQSQATVVYADLPYERATPERPVVRTPLPDGRIMLSVFSRSMNQQIPSIVQPPRDGSAPRPVLYLLNGAGGGEDIGTWQANTDVRTFLGAKDVLVVTPLAGANSYYTDWQRFDAGAGTPYRGDPGHPQSWGRFLTDELVHAVDSEFTTDGANALAGISMSGTSVLTLAEKNPGLYRAVASYSGCAETSTLAGYLSVRAVAGVRGGADVTNMWGPWPGPGWVDNDPVVNAWRLRESTPAMWISTGSGLPGSHDRLDDPGIDGRVGTLIPQVTYGAVLEANTQYCTANLQRRFAELGIPATFDFQPVGTHSWGYWGDQLHRSWPVIGAALGAA